MSHLNFDFIDEAKWSLLGIQPTGDLKAIRRAYARQIRAFNPEDHHDRFIQIREAFEAITTTVNQWREFETEGGDETAPPKERGRPCASHPGFEPPSPHSERFQTQIGQALAGDRGDLAVEALEQLIRSQPQPGEARQVVYRAIMQATLEHQLSDAMAGYLGWHWFFSNHSFQFNFQAKPDELWQFSDLLYQAMTTPIQQVIDKLSQQLAPGCSGEVVELVGQALQDPQFDQIEKHRLLRLELTRALYTGSEQLSNRALLYLNEVLDWGNVHVGQDEEDWKMLQTLREKVTLAKDGLRIPKSKEDEFDNFLNQFTMYLFLSIFAVCIVLMIIDFI